MFLSGFGVGARDSTLRVMGPETLGDAARREELDRRFRVRSRAETQLDARRCAERLAGGSTRGARDSTFMGDGVRRRAEPRLDGRRWAERSRILPLAALVAAARTIADGGGLFEQNWPER